MCKLGLPIARAARLHPQVAHHSKAFATPDSLQLDDLRSGPTAMATHPCYPAQFKLLTSRPARSLGAAPLYTMTEYSN